MPSTRKDLIEARFAVVREEFDEILARLTPDMYDWAPYEGMRTVSGQLMEVLAVEIMLVPRLKHGKDLTDEQVEEIAGDCSDFDGLKRALAETRSVTLDYLQSLSEHEIAEEVDYGRPWYGSFWLPTLPRAELFLNIAAHEYYHVGQLTSYLWSRGDDPYAW